MKTQVFKKSLFLSAAAAAVFSAGQLFAGTAYVSSFKATVYSSAAATAAPVAQVNKGAALTVLGDQAGWLKVSYAGKTGFIKKMFTASVVPGAKFSVLGSASANALVHARKRASADVTAASARGLDDEAGAAVAGRARELDSKASVFDPKAIEKVESLFVSQAELESFLSEGKLK